MNIQLNHDDYIYSHDGSLPNSEQEEIYNCDYGASEKNYRQSSEYYSHLSSHDDNRPYRCPYRQFCNKAFKRSDALKTHIRLHTGEKPYVCPINSCGMSFSTKAGLRYHNLKHRNDKVFKCDFPGCGQSFLTPTQLTQHKRRVRVHENLAIYSHAHLEEQLEAPSRDVNSVDFATMIHDSYGLEPSVSKRVQLEKFAEASQQSEDHFVYSEQMQRPSESSTLIDGYHTHGTPRSVSSLTSKTELTAQTSLSLAEQNALLKKISQVLDENLILKQHIQIYQKMVEICQLSLGRASLLPTLNQNKDAPPNSQAQGV